jgi:hypothetical protein
MGGGVKGLNDAGDRRTTRSGGCAVNRMVCKDCGTVFYSAAAKTLVEQGAVCAKCGGVLAIDLGQGSRPVAKGSNAAPDERDDNSTA